MNLSFDFTGRTALVTNAAQGLGFELCWMLAEAGARVVPVDRDARALKSTWGNASEFVLPLIFDDAEPQGALDVIAACVEWAGLDILVNSADVSPIRVSWENLAWSDLSGARLNQIVNMTRSAIPTMREQGFGRIVNVASHLGMHEIIGQEKNILAANNDIIDFTKAVAREVAAYGITVNAVSTFAEMAFVDMLSDEMKSKLASMIPLGHFANPSEISSAVGYLSSDEASYITGVVLSVDGGISI